MRLASSRRLQHNVLMGDLTSRVIQQIDDANCFEDIEGWIWMAGDLIRKADSPQYHSGFEEIDRETVSSSERQELKQAALNALPRCPDPYYVGSLLNVLGCTCDCDVSPIYVEYLAKYLLMMKASNVVVYSILSALEGIGEAVFLGLKSRSATDIERNVKEADAFLQKRGIFTPG